MNITRRIGILVCAILILLSVVTTGCKKKDKKYIYIPPPPELKVPQDYSTIQAAIDDAQPGEIVVVSDGTYTGLGNKNLVFDGKMITVKSQNGPANCIVDCQSNGRGFIFDRNETGLSVLDGFTITNASVTGTTPPDGCGAGIICYPGSPTIKNCVLTGNYAQLMGGGIGCAECSPLITDCTITNNTAGAGAGIACLLQPSPTIANCVITDNTADVSGGGGILCYGGSPAVTNCLILDNTSQAGGGIACVSLTDPIFTNCTIAGNFAADGGGVCCWEDIPSCPATATLRNCIFWANQATGLGRQICAYDSLSVINLEYCSTANGSGGATGDVFPTTTYSTKNTWTASISLFHFIRRTPQKPPT